MDLYDFVIIGAGLSGAFIARDLSRYQTKVLVLEQESDVGNKTTSANSALIHSGYDPVPGTLKAKLNVLGNAMYDEVCQDLNVKFIRTGSLTLAEKEEDLKVLEELQKRGIKNGVTTEIITGLRLFALEPNLSKNFIGALYAPTCGIIDPFLLTVNLIENAVDNGVKLHLNEKVIGIKSVRDVFQVLTPKNTYFTRFIINAAGVMVADIENLLDTPTYFISPRKGSYFVFDHFDDNFLKHVLFPLPSDKGKGIVLTPTYSGNYLAGPDSNFTDDFDDLSTDKQAMAYIKDRAKKTLPNIPLGKIIREFSGLRATPSGGDFILGPLKNYPHFINVAGIESPGLAAGPAISQYVIENFILPQFPLKKKSNFNPKIRPSIDFKTMNEAEINALIKQHPSFGHMVCRCEKVSAGQILDALSRSCPPHTFKALKKRVRTGFGRCQGGFCQPFVLKIMADYYNMAITQIDYDQTDTPILKKALGEDDETP